MGDEFFQSWDATNEQQMGDFTPLPEGKYLAQITDGEWKDTKERTGQYLQLTFEVLEPKVMAGRKVWTRLNLKNPSSEAVRIAREEMSSICHATGKLKPRGTPDLFNIPLVISVKLRKREDNGELTNEVRGYSPKPRTTAPQTAPPPQQQMATAAVAQTETAPWG